jgi:zinc/manganese transport system permease protein
MSLDAATLGILWPAFIAGLLVTATHVPLGMQVLQRGIVFIDLAVAQIAGLGVILADSLGSSPTGAAVQIAALAAALAGAMVLTWTERRWPEVQEAIIGVVFVLASSAAILLLASNPRGSENLKELLIGQILWVNPAGLPLEALFYAVILGLWFGLGERLGRIGFYLLFACAVTISVQLVGLFLVFITLVVPALATFYARKRRYLKAYAVGVLGYALGLIASAMTDLPSGSMIVCAMVVIAAVMALLSKPDVAAAQGP